MGKSPLKVISQIFTGMMILVLALSAASPAAAQATAERRYLLEQIGPVAVRSEERRVGKECRL